MNKLQCLNPLLQTVLCGSVPSRGTVVFKRKYPIRLHKLNQPPKIFRPKEYIYDVIQFEHEVKHPNVSVILTSYVEGLGQPGDQVSIRPFAGYSKYIVPGLAVYATPENITKYSELSRSDKAAEHSSKFSIKTLKLLTCRIIGVSLNDTQPWTLEPWHMRVAFRMNGFVVPESAIEMPKHVISGPEKEQHRKEFYVTVTISETERVKVRCRIHLIGINSDVVHKADWIERSQPLFEEDREVLDAMPQPSELPYVDQIRLRYNLS